MGAFHQYLLGDSKFLIFILLRLTYELVFNFVSCWQLVGLGGFLRQADDLIGLLYLGQRYLGNGWEVLQTRVVEGVGRMARDRRGDLWRGEKTSNSRDN